MQALNALREELSLPPHPAAYNENSLPILAGMVKGAKRILDPFAGTGKIHLIQSEIPNATIHTVELQPKWAAYHPATKVGNALDLPYPDDYFDCVATSPTFGNRMADHHNAQDNSRRITYTHYYGEELDSENSGLLQWGDAYREFHVKAWMEARRVLCPGATFVLHMKNHIRGGVEQDVTGWHVSTLEGLGFVEVDRQPFYTNGNGYGANGQARVDNDWFIKFRLGGNTNENFFSLSKSVDWNTPRWILDMVRQVMPVIDLDPASNAIANYNVGASVFWDFFDWGLRRAWVTPDGLPAKVWLNPPFGKYRGEGNLMLWTNKLIREFVQGNVPEAMILTTDATSDKWFVPLKNRFPIWFPNGRVSFEDATGKAIPGNTKGSAIAYLGPNEKLFRDVFNERGTVMKAI